MKNINAIKTDDLDKLVEAVVCNADSKDCMYRNCDVCMNNQLEIDEDSSMQTKVSLVPVENYPRREVCKTKRWQGSVTESHFNSQGRAKRFTFRYC